MIRVLSVASECAPFIKTGGLADVAGALPGALAGCDVHMRTLLPAYPAVKRAVGEGREVLRDDDLFGGPGRVVAVEAAGLDLLLLDAPHLFDRAGGIYLGPDGTDWPDNPERYAALCWIAARIAGEGIDGWRPQVLHCHDWQAGLAPVYLRQNYPVSGVATVITIHNIAFQGLCPYWKLTGLRLNSTGMTTDGFEYWGNISALKGALVTCDKITTVSPTYAAELTTAEFGMGLQGVILSRQGDVTGILNGVDTDAWSPPYKSPAGKAKHKKALCTELGLDPDKGPLCVVVSRLTTQKGLDLLLEALPQLLQQGGQLAVLGSGEGGLEQGFSKAAQIFDGVAAHIGYDEGLAKRMIEGGDAILVPSRFEPCGLTQLYGLRYGTIPLVSMTGGLADTIIPATPAGLWAGVATGVQFNPITTDALTRAIDQLCSLYSQPEIWLKMQQNAMRHPVGWDRSAREYAALYESLM